MGLSIGDLLGAGISLLPLPGAGAVGNFVSGLDDRARGGGNLVNTGSERVTGPAGLGTNNPYIPDVIEQYTDPIFDNNGTPCGVSVTAPLAFVQRAKAPPGYVVVNCKDAMGNIVSKQAMLKPVARALGLWKPRSKPPISAKDFKTVRTAERVVKKIDRISKMAGSLPKRRRRAS